ncbi:hypothetical protein CPB83DRAFT_843904 [Crepidotus variabilis]|uniref:Uncharacterized protein n=1 Tax=Crepidotus variabilis TaxID=179855 RepID=A0A9P6ET95_9AGAR|nr:hypothetical protein CPB83DRAFT_843904 [Crepidotus variabilis]
MSLDLFSTDMMPCPYCHLERGHRSGHKLKYHDISIMWGVKGWCTKESTICLQGEGPMG